MNKELPSAATVISRIMSRLPLSASAQDLALAINLAQPNGATDEQWREWGEEKNKALAEWTRELPSSGHHACPGGELVTTPISTAKPIPLPAETLEQTDFLQP